MFSKKLWAAQTTGLGGYGKIVPGIWLDSQKKCRIALHDMHFVNNLDLEQGL
jgi:hypothetical protein